MIIPETFKLFPDISFDPNCAAILLVGGNKRGDKRWYKKNLAIADERFQRHLKRLEQ